jgi:hypothetical protein
MLKDLTSLLEDSPSVRAWVKIRDSLAITVRPLPPMKDFLQPTATSVDRDVWRNFYNQQSDLDRYILRLCSVIYGPVSRNNLLACLNRALPKSTKAFSASSLKTHIDHLSSINLLISNNLGPQCRPIIVEIATREAIEEREFDRFVLAIQQTLPVRTGYRGGRQFANRSELIREVRIGLYKGDTSFVAKQLEDYTNYSYDRGFSFPDLLNSIFNNPFDARWIEILSPEYPRCLSGWKLAMRLALTPKAIFVAGCSSTSFCCEVVWRMLAN